MRAALLGLLPACFLLVSCQYPYIKEQKALIEPSGSSPRLHFQGPSDLFHSPPVGWMINVFDLSSDKLLWKISTAVPTNMRETVFKSSAPPNVPEEPENLVIKEVTYGQVPERWYQIYPEAGMPPIPLNEESEYMVTLDQQNQRHLRYLGPAILLFKLDGACEQLSSEEFRRRSKPNFYPIGHDDKCLAKQLSSPGLSADEVPAPVTIAPYIALFGGFTSPTKTEARVNSPSRNSHFTVLDQGFSPSKSLGGRIGAWFPNFRKRTGFDFGLELDVTNYQPDIKTGPFKATGISRGTPVTSITWQNKIDIDATLVTVNLLARLPLYVSKEFPHGRMYPYGGGGIGLHNTDYGDKKVPNTFGVQALAGAHVFLSKRISFFSEYKYTWAQPTLEFATSTERYTLAVHHVVFGFAFHFIP